MGAVVTTAKLFSCRPSSLLRIEDPWVALAFDLAAAKTALEATSGAERHVTERICL